MERWDGEAVPTQGGDQERVEEANDRAETELGRPNRTNLGANSNKRKEHISTYMD